MPWALITRQLLVDKFLLRADHGSSTTTRGSAPSLDGCWRTWRPLSSHSQKLAGAKACDLLSLAGGDARIARGHAQGRADQEAKTSSKACSPGLPFSIARIARVPSL